MTFWYDTVNDYDFPHDPPDGPSQEEWDALMSEVPIPAVPTDDEIDEIAATFGEPPF